MYLVDVVVGLRPETVSVYSSQGNTALHVGVPVACAEGFATRYGPPTKVMGPLASVSTPPPGVTVAGADWGAKRRALANAAEKKRPLMTNRATVANNRHLDCVTSFLIMEGIFLPVLSLNVFQPTITCVSAKK
jgi:hypothetical protein